MVYNEDFFDSVYQVVRLIPKGRVTSYGSIAKYLGVGKAARMVGWAIHASHNAAPPVPTHRVVNRNGLLTGKSHFAYPNQMETLLNNEGVLVKKDQVVNFKTHFWDVEKELNL